jgi:VWFA-related protein
MGVLTAVTLSLLQLGATPPAEVRTVLVSMTDESGAPVEDVRLEEVALLENGVARELTRVERDARPLTLAVIVDSSEPIRTSFRLHVVEAVMRFLNRLPAGSLYSLWTTGDRPTKLVDFTDDKGAALQPLKRVFPRGGNTLLDALVEASRDLVKREGERTVIVSVTGANIGFSNYDRRRVVEIVAGNAMQFLSVEFLGADGAFVGAGDPSQVGRLDYEYVLSQLAEKTGGRFETTLSSMGLDRTLQRLSADLRGQYRISYATLPELEKRELEVQVARPEVRVRVGQVAGGSSE